MCKVLIFLLSVTTALGAACPGDVQCGSCHDAQTCGICIDSLLTPTGCDTDIEKIDHCWEYDTKNTCKLCERGFVPKQGKCVACKIPGCAQCDDIETCNACFNNVLTDRKSCSNTLPKCADSNCDVCEDEKICESCFSGFAVNKDASCSPAPANCYLVEDGKCEACQSGFYLTTSNTCEIAPTRLTGHKLLWFIVALLIIALMAMIIYFATKKRESEEYNRAEPY